MVVIQQSDCIWTKRLYSGINGCTRVKWLYSDKSCCIRAKVVVFRMGGCTRIN